MSPPVAEQRSSRLSWPSYERDFFPPMRVLFVTPSEVSSGEAVTALHMARDLTAAGSQVGFLASAFTAAFLRHACSGRITLLTPDLAQNRASWKRLLREFRPDVIVFADYPLLFFPGGTCPLADESWALALDQVDAMLVSLDHLGYAQRPQTIYFGPPHLSFYSVATPALPSRMAVLLPCPVQAPGPLDGRRGVPFRYWGEQLSLREAQLQQVRRAYLRDARDLLIFHSTPTWAWRMAERWGLPYYGFLSRILQHYLTDLPRPTTVISINNGRLLAASENPRVRIVNLAPLPSAEYERLLLACDLMVTENGVSVTLGKAVCGLRPCAVLRNSFPLVDLLGRLEGPLRRMILEMERLRLGSVFPYAVFPIWRADELEQLDLFRHNSLAEGFARVEVFGGEATRQQLHGLLLDRDAREALAARQEVYVRQLASVCSPAEALRGVLGR